MKSSFYEAKYILEGKELSEILYLPSAQDVRNELGKRNISPLSVREKKINWWEEEVISSDYKKQFLQSISFHVESGMSPAKALSIVVEGEENRSIRKRLELAQEVQNRGGSFSEALRTLKFFPEGVLALLEVGEKTGTLADSIETANTYLEETAKNNKGFYAQVIILTMEFLFGFSGVVTIQYTLLPWIEEQIKGSAGQAEPERMEYLTRSIELAYSMNFGLMLLGIVLFLVVVTIVMLLKFGSKKVQLPVSRFVSKIPGMKAVIYDSILYVHFFLISRMLSKGASFENAVQVCINTSRMQDLKAMWQNVVSRLESGHEISYAMRQDSHITKSESTQLQHHQDSNQLQRVFTAMGDYRKQTAASGKKRVGLIGFVISMVYSGLSLLIALWIIKLQGQGFNLSMG